MSQSLMVVRLSDKTKIYTRDWDEFDRHFLVRNTKCINSDGNIMYVSEELRISKDAIDVWFRIRRDDA